MSQANTNDLELVEKMERFIRDYYRDEIAELAQKYPREQKALVVNYQDVYKWDKDVADDLLSAPGQILEYFEEALRQVELPVDVSLGGAHVRVTNLPEMQTFYPGHFSPTDHAGELRSIRGEISKATDVYSRAIEVAFECQRCGTLTRMPQSGGDFQEPHECQGCERQGPFRINENQTEFVDAQKLRVQTPPEEAQGDGQDIDVFVEDDLAGEVTAGDRVTITGSIELDQQSSGRSKDNIFDPFVDAVGLEVEETDAQDIDITADEKATIQSLASGEQGDPLELAAETLAPKIHGNDIPKQAIILALVGGARTEYSDKDFDRGEFHVLLIGDPSTGKSKLVNRAEQIGWRSVGVSGKGSTVAGVTATAVQDDFGDGSWTLDAGAAVKAHRGVLAVDELDDMPAEVRSALLEPMSKQTIHVTKGGINTKLQTRTAVVAAANPEYDRFDPYEPIGEQFVFSSTLLSRFDLVYTFRDVPDKEQDAEIGGHVLDTRDAAKREERGEDVDEDAHRTPIDATLLRKWIALAKQQPKPVFANDDVRDAILEQYQTLRGMHGYDEDGPVPVTARKLEGIVRVAEAAAKFEFSETITDRHVEIASTLVGESMQDVGKDPETGELDADITETGRSKSQKDRIKDIVDIIEDVQSEYDEGAPIDVVIDRAEEEGIEASKVTNEIETLKSKGVAISPRNEHVRYIGEH
jgi:replicative DNA helicase Mcm